tara:strand:+ start:1782 stop:1967 length:186 start_codon:yes stop_codon:yes gene_type:complete
MKKYNLDLFKISITIILIGFLYCFYQYTQNGRYTTTDVLKITLDTRTGKLKTQNIETPDKP